jgi:iron(III) transport system substrate-binding protein
MTITMRAGALALAGAWLSGCSDRTADGADAAQATVVLYTSADDMFLRPILDAFADEHGVRVELVGDTEATKTTGLMMRLLAEKDRPRADVWWSSEPLATIHLSQEGVLEPGAMAGMVPENWPAELVGAGHAWLGMAERARVIAYAADRVPEPPRTLADLTEPEWKNRVGIAVPQFGTTRGHMALLHARWGAENFAAWLRAMEANGVRVYDGNARVVRAVYEGEIDVCLTDTDDAWVAQANGWPVEVAYEAERDHPRWPSRGPTTIPNTVAVVRGGPNPEHARALAAFLVSPRLERLLAESDSRNIPVHPALRAEFSALAPNDAGTRPDYADAFGSVGPAMDLCERILTP